MADLGTRYATALFQLAEESGALSDILEQAEFLYGTFKGEDGALRILTHPLISTDEKNAFVDSVYGGVHPILFGFMKLAIAKNREAFLSPALKRLIKLIKRHQNHTSARIVTATPLTDEQKHRLSATLSKKLGKKVDLHIIVDPAQIAGISIHIEGYFLDRTVKTMLKNMKESLEVHE
jgi:F-type H+-transporting ATPase subunit delta